MFSCTVWRKLAGCSSACRLLLPRNSLVSLLVFCHLIGRVPLISVACKCPSPRAAVGTEGSALTPDVRDRHPVPPSLRSWCTAWKQSAASRSSATRSETSPVSTSGTARPTSWSAATWTGGRSGLKRPSSQPERECLVLPPCPQAQCHPGAQPRIR